MKIFSSTLFYYQPTKGKIMESNDLVGSLAKAQAKIRNAKRDGKNNFLGNEYATLSSVFNACKDALSSEGIALIQVFNTEIGEGGSQTFLKTELLKGKESISSSLPINLGNDPHKNGSQITYARRYSISTLLGICTETDDDANQAQGIGTTPAPRAPKPKAKKEPEQDIKADARAIVEKVEGAESWLMDTLGEKDPAKLYSNAFCKRIIALGIDGITKKVGGSK